MTVTLTPLEINHRREDAAGADRISEAPPDRGPWGFYAVERNGLRELRQLARDLAARNRPPAEVLVALHRRARLLADAKGFPMQPMLPLVLEIFPGWDIDAEAERVEREWRQRAEAAADWLRRHGGEWDAERVVRAIELELASIVDQAGGNTCRA